MGRLVLAVAEHERPRLLLLAAAEARGVSLTHILLHAMQLTVSSPPHVILT
jgi:hypothetical protein